MMKRWIAALGAATALSASMQGAEDLAKGFANPPDSAKPWVYWFPLDGNISSNGITADLEAMKQAGIGGVLYMETDQGAPRGPAGFGGPLWRNLFKHICSEASRLGIEVNMNNDAGWCGSGGPWITPEMSMQRVVWAETNLSGPSRFEAQLPQGTANKNFYRDIAVYAFPTPSKPYAIPHLNGKSSAAKEEIQLRSVYPSLPSESIVATNRLVDLTSRMDSQGRLAWDVPAGQWTILRMGHTTTGKDNHPAPIDGRGLECDKLSKQAAEIMFEGLMGKLIADSRPLVGEGKTLVSTHIDSWEVGSQNWTPRFREEFQRLRGYDPMPFLPVMCGRVIENLEVSERFLWDIRQTVSDLLLENYAGHFRAMARRHGMRLSIEAYDGVPTDDMAYAGRADEPMAEFWSWSKFGMAYTCTEMASAAHIYGRPILGAEAFTATDAEKWQGHPANVKDLGDWAFCEGINRFVFHRYALQPWTNPDRPPGMSMGPWGLHYERTQTWWKQSKAWHEYLARCQYLLQKGLFVADLCFLAPERSPQQFKTPVKSGLDRPGYNFDGCPPEALLTRMTVKNGRLTLPDGMSYRMLVLPRVPSMTPQLLRKIKELVAAGATVVGAPPVKAPGLSGYPGCDREVQALAAELWGTSPAPAEATARPYGKGQIIWGGEFKLEEEAGAQAESPIAHAKWIWTPEGNPAASAPVGKRFFHRVVTVDADSRIASARLVMTADNSFECWINGKRAGEGDNFGRTYSIDAATLLKPGQNVVAVAAVNATSSPNPAGLVGSLAIQYASGKTVQIDTDSQWKSAISAAGDWMTAAVADTGWTPAIELGVPGMAPWGDVDSNATAADPTPDASSLCRLLSRMGVPPDFASQSADGASNLRYIHRTVNGMEVYFVANKNPRAEEAVCAFRVEGRQPELWHPDTGKIEMPAVYDVSSGCTRLPIRFEPNGSVFVVFKRSEKTKPNRIASVSRDGLPVADAAKALPASANDGFINLTRSASGAVMAQVARNGSYEVQTTGKGSRSFTVSSLPNALTLDGPWDLSFPPNWGAPARIALPKLISWSEHADPGVKYFSGTAAYTKTFAIAPDLLAKNRSWQLDLGSVAVMAEVKVNGRNLGILWKPPYVVDVGSALKAGENQLEIQVVNLWINRQIGDEFLPEDSERNPDGTLKSWPAWLQEGKPSPSGRFTFSSWRLWKKNDPLVESGLIGPVTLKPIDNIVVK